MKCISKIGIIDDDITLAYLSDGSTVQLYTVHRNGETYYKIKIDNTLCPVGTSKSGVMFTEHTRFFYS